MERKKRRGKGKGVEGREKWEERREKRKEGREKRNLTKKSFRNALKKKSQGGPRS